MQQQQLLSNHCCISALEARFQEFSQGKWDFPQGKWDFPQGKWDFPQGKWDFTQGKWDFPQGKWDFTQGKWDFTQGKWNFTRKIVGKNMQQGGLASIIDHVVHMLGMDMTKSSYSVNYCT